MPRILIFGAGSIGVYLGCLLAKTGNDVTLLGHGKLKKLHDTILINEQVFAVPNRIYETPKGEKFDFIFITSKLYDLRKNLETILQSKISASILISIQNGIVDESFYKPYLGKSKHVSISVFEGYRLLEDQLLVTHTEEGWKTENNEIGKKVAKLLKNAGINCQPQANLEAIKAEKTIMNCAINLLSAIEKKTFYELTTAPTTRARMDRLFDEAFTVLSKRFKLGSRDEMLERFHQVIAPMRHYSSTYQDVVAKHETEVDFLNGYIVKLAKEYNIPVPENEKILKEFKKLT